MVGTKIYKFVCLQLKIVKIFSNEMNRLIKYDTLYTRNIFRSPDNLFRVVLNKNI